MSRVLQDECVLGIWRSDAHRSLVWFVEPTSDAMKSPSKFLDHPPGIEVEYLHALSNSEVSFNSYEGRIRITGALAEIKTIDLQRATGCQVIFDPRPAAFFYEFGIIRYDKIIPSHVSQEMYQEVVLGERSFILPIMDGGYSSSLRAQYCLLLQPTQRLYRSGLWLRDFKRLGLNSNPRPTEHLYHDSLRTHFKRVGLFIVDRSVSSICINDPDKCEDEKCVQQIKPGDVVMEKKIREITIGDKVIKVMKRCQGELGTVWIV